MEVGQTGRAVAHWQRGAHVEVVRRRWRRRRRRWWRRRRSSRCSGGHGHRFRVVQTRIVHDGWIDVSTDGRSGGGVAVVVDFVIAADDRGGRGWIAAGRAAGTNYARLLQVG